MEDVGNAAPGVSVDHEDQDYDYFLRVLRDEHATGPTGTASRSFGTKQMEMGLPASDVPNPSPSPSASQRVGRDQVPRDAANDDDGAANDGYAEGAELYALGAAFDTEAGVGNERQGQGSTDLHTGGTATGTGMGIGVSETAKSRKVYGSTRSKFNQTN